MNGGDVSCKRIRAQFSSYLDGAVTGIAMQRIASHLRDCGECAEEFDGLRSTQAVLASLGPVKAPDDLALRLRVAISNERTRTPRNLLHGLRVRWENSIAPFLLQASAGFASTVLLVGSVALLIGMFARPEPLAARDVPLGMASNPHFLYSSVEPEAVPIGGRDNPVIVEAYIDGVGRVYDYHIVSGPNDASTRSALENVLLFSVFEPARFFGQPVRGLAVLSFTGISVRA
jgi:anti-sigma factor RsiW